MEADIELLLQSCEMGDLDRVKSLLDAGVDIHLRNEKGWNALTVAAFHQHVKLAEFLLARGANPNSKNIKGTTALMYAKTRATDFKMLELLLQRGADINARDNFGLTILDYVRKTGVPEISEFLERRGALPSAELPSD